MLESAAYQKIMALRGMTEFKELAERMRTLAENRRKLSTARLQLPNFVFASDPGCGVTTHLKLFTQLLYELNLQRFEGDRRCFEAILDHNAFKDGNFDALLGKLRDQAGFYRHFCGVVGIEIDDWVDDFFADELDRLLQFADDVFGQVLLVFEVGLRSDEQLAGLVKRLSLQMPLEVVRFPLPSAEELCQYLRDFLIRRGFEVPEETTQKLREVMPELMCVYGFDGFQTLDNMADEIIYHYVSRTPVSGRIIPADALNFLKNEGGYLERLSHRKRAGH